MGQDIADTEIDAAAAVTDSATGWADKVIAVLTQLKSGNNPFGSAALRAVDTTEESGVARQLMPLDSAGKVPTGHLRAAAPGQAGVIPAIRSGDIAGTTPGVGTADRAVATDTGGRLPAKFLPAATTAASGIVRLAAAGETTGSDVVQASAMAGVPRWQRLQEDVSVGITTADTGTAFNFSVDISETSNDTLALELRLAEAVLPLQWIPRARISEARTNPGGGWDGRLLLWRESVAPIQEINEAEGVITYRVIGENVATPRALLLWMPSNRQLRVQNALGEPVWMRRIWRVSGIPA